MFIKIGAKENILERKKVACVKGLRPPKHPGFFGVLAPHTPYQWLLPQAPDCSALNPRSQLVIGYHWLAFLNSVSVSKISVEQLKMKKNCKRKN